MGLEIVDIVIKIEDAFNISIPDKELEKTVTVGDLSTLAYSKIASYNPNVCQTSAAFYRFRQALCKYLGFTREQIIPSTNLNLIFPPEKRNKMWQSLKEESSISLPCLSPTKFANASVVICLMAVLSVLVALELTGNFAWSYIPVGLLTFIIIMASIYKRDYGEFPGSVVTVGDIARISAVKMPIGEILSEEATFEVVRKIICDYRRIDPSTITPETRIVEDLDLA